MGKWDNFNAKVDEKELRKQIEEAKKNNEETPAGEYIGVIEKMELKASKAGAPMFAVQFRIKTGDYKNKCLFLNKVMAGTKNDAAMISSVEGFLEKLECSFDTNFYGDFDKFEDVLLDVVEDMDGINIKVKYDPKAFNSISVIEVME
jgi:hypothetical protein